MIQLSLFEDENKEEEFINNCIDKVFRTSGTLKNYIVGDIEEIDWTTCGYSIVGGERAILNNKQITIQRKGKEDIIVTEAEIRNRLNHLKREYLEEVL